MPKRILINYLPNHRCIIWMPPKTGTNHAEIILKKFGLGVYELVGGSLNNLKLTSHDKYVHDNQLPSGPENYTFITTARNPYSRLVSLYKMVYYNNEPKQDFYSFVFTHCYDKMKNQFRYPKKYPDYFIRLENLVEDYSKINFIRNSDFYTSGQLADFCTKKVNEAPEPEDFRKYYNQSIADMVYYNFSKYFIDLEYDRDSWKF